MAVDQIGVEYFEVGFKALHESLKNIEGSSAGTAAALEKMASSERVAEESGLSLANLVTGTLSVAFGQVLTSSIERVTGAIGGLISSGVDLNSQMEGFTNRFNVLLGSVEATEERMAALVDFGKRTPFEFSGVVEADLILQNFGLHAEGVAERFGFSGERIRTIVGDTASGVGQGFKDMAALIGRFSAGATGEALTRFQELGVVTRQELAAMGIQFSKSGQLLSPLPEAMDAVLTSMQSKFGGLMDVQSASLEGMSSNLQDWFDDVRRRLGEPLFDRAKEGLAGLLDALSSPEVDQAVDNLAGAIERAVDVVSSIFGGLEFDAAEWGAGTINAFADGILAGVGAVESAIGWIADLMAYWMEPGSPPRFLKDIDKWGAGTMDAYMSGWEKADWSVFDDLGKMIEDELKSAVEAGELSEQDLIPSILGSRAAITKAISEVKSVGSVSEDTFNTIIGLAGRSADSVGLLLREYTVLQKATREIDEANRELTKADRQLARAQSDYYKAVLSGDATKAEKNALTMARLSRDKAKAELDAAKASQSAASSEVDNQRRILAERKKNDDLIRKQADLLEKQQAAAKAEADKRAKAERDYKFSIADSAGQLAILRGELADTEEGSIEYYKLLTQVSQLENKVAKEKASAEADAEAERERAAKQASDEAESREKAERDYKFAISDTAGQLAILKGELGDTEEGSVEYFKLLTQIHQLEQKQAKDTEKDKQSSRKEAERNAKEAERLAKQAEKDAQARLKAERNYKFAIADTAGKLAILREELSNTEEGSVEYYRILTQIAQLERKTAGGAISAEGVTATKKNVKDVTTQIDDLRDKFDKVGKDIGSISSGVGIAIEKYIKSPLSDLRESFSFLADDWTDVSNMFRQFALDVGPSLSVIFGRIAGGAGLVGSNVDGLVQTLTSLGKGILEFFLDTVSVGIFALAGDGEAALDKLRDLGKNALDNLKKTMKAFADWVAGWFGSSWDETTRSWSDSWKMMGQIVDLTFDSIGKWIEEKFTGIKNWLFDNITSLDQWWSSRWNAMKESVMSTWIGMSDFITTKTGDIRETIETGFNDAKDFVSSSLDDMSKSASEKFESIRASVATSLEKAKESAKAKLNDIKQTFSDTLKSVGDGVKKSMEDVGKSFVDGLVSVGAWIENNTDLIKSWGATISDSILKAFEVWKQNNPFISALLDAFDAVVEWLATQGKSLARIGSAIIDGIIEGMQASYGALVDYLKGIISDIIDSVLEGFGIGGGDEDGGAMGAQSLPRALQQTATASPVTSPQSTAPLPSTYTSSNMTENNNNTNNYNLTTQTTMTTGGLRLEFDSMRLATR